MTKPDHTSNPDHASNPKSLKSPAKAVSSIVFRVRYAETDAMGVAHHANYPVWFEMGRSTLMRELGQSYAALEQAGFYLMLSDLQVRYLRSARYDDELQLQTTVHELKSRGVTFEYQLLRGDERLATGTTKHICTNHQYQAVRLPSETFELLQT